ncbi:Reticulon-domain-containing protein [Absidia repens]|uniref:Reticulon-like protein n=1 Tax=Absidia repens TaxID=90262 RepID=A0A1X2IIZ5_9FUNG|nr:Reticulon-domain-containing protein [Absidia repens]
MIDILSPSFTNGHKYMGKSNVTTATTPAEGIAPPSPRLSMDENTLAMLMEDKQLQENKRTSAVLDQSMVEEEPEELLQTIQANDDQSTSKKPIIDTSMNMVSDAHYINHNKNFPYQSPTAVEFAHDPSTYLVNKTKSLVYWEYPSHSAGLLCFILGGTWMTRYYSVLYLLSGLFTVVTSINWMYVNVNFHSHRILSGKRAETILHPHGGRLLAQKRRTWFTEAQVDHACEVTMNLMEGILKQVIDLVLIEDSVRSIYAVGISFMVWTLASLLSMKTMVMVMTVISFVVPRLYLEHQEKVDAWVLERKQKAHLWAQRHHAQCQTWLRQYHIAGQYLMAGLTVCYQSLSQLTLFLYEKQQQWIKQRQHAATALKQKEVQAPTTADTAADDDVVKTAAVDEADDASVAN